MAAYYDIYVLVPDRTVEAIERFQARFAGIRQPAATEYEVPRYSDIPVAVFRTPEELIAHCLVNLTETQAIYWRCLDAGDPAHAMVFFTADGGLILGLSVAANPVSWLGELFAAMNGTVGWVGFEEPPPDTSHAFAALAERCA